MKKTRLSFFYLASYLLATGVCFLLAPVGSLRMLGARGTYDPIFVRFVGSFMVALGTVVVQIIRYRLEVLYRTTLFIRGFFIVVILWLYELTKDPLFLVILGVVSLGMILTLAGFMWDWKRRNSSSGTISAPVG